MSNESSNTTNIERLAGVVASITEVGSGESEAEKVIAVKGDVLTFVEGMRSSAPAFAEGLLGMPRTNPNEGATPDKKTRVNIIEMNDGSTLLFARFRPSK